MRKAFLTLVMLGSLSVSAMAADFDLNGKFGYRFDSIDLAAGPKSEKDRTTAELVFSNKVNDKVKAVVGVRTGGDFNSSYGDMGPGNKDVDLHLAYVEYAAMDNVKVTLGKMHQPWANSSSLFFDRDVKPEGVAVSWKNGSGLFANLSSLKLVEGGVADDSKVQSLQVGLKKNLAGLDLVGAVALHNHDVKGLVGVRDAELQQAFASVGTKFAGKPVNLFVDYLKNDKARADDTALAYGVKFGNAKKPQEWDLSVFHQEVEANAQFGLWHDTDFALAQGGHDGYGVTAGYVVADGWKVHAKYFDVEIGRADVKRLQIDLNYLF
jgi:Putative porin